ncbi:MAG: hypothetical protein IKP71_04440, partial [Candidatus Riflebacteria bacterium]|nr:hypothetical protein [Candidatus Riflebacteria bacterium]
MYLKLSVKTKLLLLTILFACILNQAFADPPALLNSSITSDDSIVRIGSTITVTVEFKSDAAGTNATVNLTGISNPGINTLSCNNIGGDIFLGEGTFPVVAGTKENNSTTNVGITLINASDTESVTATLIIDNKPPKRRGVMTCKVNGSNYV